jgi:hypothetical protein
MDARVSEIGKTKFLQRVERSPKCWEWTGVKNPAGYGQMSVRVDGKVHTVQAHRIAYELYVGPMPAGLEVDHLCRNRGCVRPTHLEAVTHLVNMQRSARARAAERAVA